MSDELASLSAQLPENLAQLAQLDELLQADPTNDELISIRNDLQQVIQTTLDLQKAAGQTPPEDAAAAAAAASSHSSGTSSALGSSSTAAAASFSIYDAPTPVAAAAAASVPASAASAGLPVGGVYPPGSRVMGAYKDGKFYVCRIDRVDESAEQYTVTYLEYNQTATLSFDEVRPWVSATADQLRMVNTPVKALFPEDGLFYNASIDGPSSTPGFFVVKFGHLGTKKKKKVEVALADIIINERFMNPLSLQLTSAASNAAKPALTEEMPIPEYLVIQPTDSEAVKAQKKKKLSKLRFDHRKAWEEQESNKRASSWADFKAGKGPKRPKLSHAAGMQQLKKTSIFATPDSAEGVVGVVGSGRGMTDHASIKKHIFAQQPQ